MIELHGVTGPPGSRLEALVGEALSPLLRRRPVVSAFERVVADVSGSRDAVDSVCGGLPEGAARAEAIAVRLRRSGAELVWGEPRRLESAAELLELCRARGASSVAVARADPSLVPELQLGTWFDASIRLRLLRRAALGLPAAGRAAGRAATTLTIAVEGAFWRGVRSAATRTEWQRWTHSAYVALLYHRLAGEGVAGQEHVDLAPAKFHRQLRLLRRLGFRHLRADELLAFHEDAVGLVPRRAFVVTFDDGIRDAFEPLMQHGAIGPLMFVCSQEAGRSAHWLGNEPVLDWDDVRRLATAGVGIGSHTRRHPRLTQLASAALAEDLAGSRAEVRAEVPGALDLLAYPYGDHDARVRDAAVVAGYRAAFTTERGPNGAGTDRHLLRRVSVHAADGALAVVWKAATGESLPRWWLRLRGEER
jgi:peptidoglycan/xylan/chitin deacetylase (PgdA/CDA1 family)